MNRRHTICHAQVGPFRIPQKACRDTLRGTCGLHPVGSVGHVVLSIASEARNVYAIFFMVGWVWDGFLTKRAGTRYPELVLFHPVECASCSAFRFVRSMKHLRTIFHARVGSVRIPQKARWDTLGRTCVLHPVGSTGHVVHFSASGPRNVDKLFVILRWERYGFYKKRVETHYAKLEFLHPVGSAGHVVHSGPPRPQNVKALFFMLEWDRYGYYKKRVGTRYAELVLLSSVGSVGHVVRSSVSGL
jgi:hypothetical protein